MLAVFPTCAACAGPLILEHGRVRCRHGHHNGHTPMPELARGEARQAMQISPCCPACRRPMSFWNHIAVCLHNECPGVRMSL